MAGPEAAVAAVITTRNGSTRGFVFDAIESVLAQTTPPREILLVDDASDDGTAEDIRRRFGDAVPILSLPQNLGPSGARNAGVTATRSPLVAFLDDDDQWLPHRLEVQLPWLAASTTALVCGPVQLVNSAGQAVSHRRSAYQEGFTWPGILFHNPVLGPSTVLVRREALLRTGGFPVQFRMGEDWHLWARIARFGAIQFLDRPLARYRLHGQQAAADKGLAWIRKQTLETLRDLVGDLSPRQQALVLNTYASGGVVRALMDGNLSGAYDLATAATGRIDCALIGRRAASGILGKLIPPLYDPLNRHDLRRLIHCFGRLS
jgi:glycosyltransferase involved in cell wall biosynthesis